MIRILIGKGTCGLAAGAEAVSHALEHELKQRGIDHEIIAVGCIGFCYMEPLVDIVLPGKARITYQGVAPTQAQQIVEKTILGGEVIPDLVFAQMRPPDGPHKCDADKPYTGHPYVIENAVPWDGVVYYDETDVFKHQIRRVLQNCGVINPLKIEDYEVRGGYQALKKAITGMTPEQVIEEVKKSGLRGRGGAGFSTGMKWGFARAAKGVEKYIICNADEGDPGAFMNRSLMEGDPHSVIEGMVIGAYAMGASVGYVYVRAEYPLAVKTLKHSVEIARQKNYLGKNILGSGFDFDLVIYEGAGAFVCGEETALIASIEGFRGMPRPKPPFPANSGVWAKPTNINNVETWGTVPQIILNGTEWFTKYGSEKSRGTKTFAITGKIKNTGLVEIPMGTPLSKVLYEIGGGMLNKKKAFKAAQMGGPSGGNIAAATIDTPMDYESVQAAGAIIGSGGVVVMSEDSCMVDVAKFFLTFSVSESCGKCTPCRVGTKVMLDILERITTGQGEEGDIEKLEELGQTIKASSLCGLGQTAPNPVLSTIRYFRDEYEAHIKKKECPARRCYQLVKFIVNPELCTKCGICFKNCPNDAITWQKKEVAFIRKEACVSCGKCVEVCPHHSID